MDVCVYADVRVMYVCMCVCMYVCRGLLWLEYAKIATAIFLNDSMSVASVSNLSLCRRLLKGQKCDCMKIYSMSISPMSSMIGHRWYGYRMERKSEREQHQ